MKIMGKRKVVFVVLCLAVMSSVGWCWGENMMEQGKETASNAIKGVTDAIPSKDGAKDAADQATVAAQEKAGAAVNKANDMAGAAVDKANDIAANTKKVAAEVGNKASDVVDNVKNKASNMAAAGGVASPNPNIASDTVNKPSSPRSNINNNNTQMLKQNATEAYSYFLKDKAEEAMASASNMAGDAKNMVNDKSSNMYKQASGKIGENTTERIRENATDAYSYFTSHPVNNVYLAASEKLGNMAGDAKDMVKDTKANEAYQGAKEAVKTNYDAAKEKAADATGNLAEKAKTSYEAAKEKASDATGQLGKNMGNVGEL